MDERNRFVNDKESINNACADYVAQLAAFKATKEQLIASGYTPKTGINNPNQHPFSSTILRNL